MNNITREQFESFEEVRESGKTNMYDLKTVGLYSGLEKSEIKEIMKNYDELMEKYNGYAD